MTVRPRVCLSILAGLAIATSAPASFADDPVAAQELFDQGKAAMAARNYSEACPKFEESLRLQPAIGALLNLAACYEQMGKFASAWSRYLELSTKAAAAGQKERALIGKRRAAALAPRLSRLVVLVDNPTAGLEVKRDGTIIGPVEWGTAIPTDPGEHVVEASAPGKLPWSGSVTVVGAAATATIRVPELASAPKAPPPRPVVGALLEAPLERSASPADRANAGSIGFGTQKILSLVTLGIGVAGVGVGTYFGIQSLSTRNEANGLCPAFQCPPGPDGARGYRLWGDARTAADRSTLAFAVGGVGLAAATVLWFTAPRAGLRTSAQSQLGIGAGSIHFQGTW